MTEDKIKELGFVNTTKTYKVYSSNGYNSMININSIANLEAGDIVRQYINTDGDILIVKE